MKKLPPSVEQKPVKKCPLREDSLGISLRVPSKLQTAFRDELLNIIQGSNSESILEVLARRYGFIVFDFSFEQQLRSTIPDLEDLGPDKNYTPLIWHKDGGSRKMATSSLLFTDVEGPPRLSKTIFSTADAVFPSLIDSLGNCSAQLLTEDAPETLVEGIKKVRRGLEIILHPSSRNLLVRDQLINTALYQMLEMLDFLCAVDYLDPSFINEMLTRSVNAAKKNAVVHRWKVPQTILLSNEADYIHCRLPTSRKKGVKGGRLFAKAIFS